MAKKPTAKQLAKSKNKKVAAAAKNAIAAETIAKAGAKGSNRNSTGAARDQTTTTTTTDATTGEVKTFTNTVKGDPSKGELNWGGKIYTKDSLGALKKDLNAKGVSLTKMLSNNPKARAILGVSDRSLGSMKVANKSLRRARRLNRRSS